MKFVAAVTVLCVGSATAFAPAQVNTAKSQNTVRFGVSEEVSPKCNCRRRRVLLSLTMTFLSLA
jgi:hypothetical protein